MASRAGPIVTVTVKVWLTLAPSRSVALAMTWAVAGWCPVTRRFFPLIVAVATAVLSLEAVKVSGGITVIALTETKFATLIGLGLGCPSTLAIAMVPNLFEMPGSF